MPRTIQKMPKIPPTMTAKTTRSAYEVAGIQNTHTQTEHANVLYPATSILPYRSLNNPMQGRPNMVPRFSSAVTEDA